VKPFASKSKIVRAAKWAKDHTISDMKWIAGMTKNESSYDDMTIELRRVIIAARFRSPSPEQATPQETRAVPATWAATGT